MIRYEALTPEYFQEVLDLTNFFYGDNYLDFDGIVDVHRKGIKDGFNANILAFEGERIVGFRLTQSPGQWELDRWWTPQEWHQPVDRVCCFKCAAVHEDMRGQGIAKTLLQKSIEQVKKQGALAGVAQVWRESPKNSAFMYFSRCGGVFIKDHLERWAEDCINDGYICSKCGNDCKCTSAEMIIHFD